MEALHVMPRQVRQVMSQTSKAADGPMYVRQVMSQAGKAAALGPLEENMEESDEELDEEEEEEQEDSGLSALFAKAGL
eukprot:scaffold171010_cov14-Tisochrysis_lutea.AAC.1